MEVKKMKKYEKVAEKMMQAWLYMCKKRKTTDNMSKQAENSLNLYRGGNPSTIQQLLKMQAASVVNELKEHFNAASLSELAIKLSRG